MNSVKSSKITC